MRRAGGRWRRRLVLSLSLFLALAVAAALVAFWRPMAIAAAPELAGVKLVPVVASQPGYDRSCSPRRGCVFGPAWSDDVRVRWGRDGCDTRNQVLARDLTEVEIKPGTHGCVVVFGVLRDRYSDEIARFSRSSASQVPIDHVVALSAAWDRGAASWDAQLRRDFANDPDNLTATTQSVNSRKGDKTPASWSPSTRTGACWYAQTYLTVVRRYDLAVTAAEAFALASTLRDCPTHP